MGLGPNPILRQRFEHKEADHPETDLEYDEYPFLGEKSIFGYAGGGTVEPTGQWPLGLHGDEMIVKALDDLNAQYIVKLLAMIVLLVGLP